MPYENNGRGNGGKPRGGYNGSNNRGGYNGNKPYKKYDDNRGGYQGGDKAYKKFDDNRGGYQGGGKPYKKFDDNRGGYNGGDKPYKKFDDNRGGYNGGDKPYKKFDDNRGGYQGGDKPYKKYDDNRGGYNGGNKPYKKFGDEKPYKKFADERNTAPVQETAPVNNEDELPYIVMGRNAVREALKSGRSIDRILVVKELDGSLRELVNLARDNNVQLREVDRAKLDELCMPFGHGGKTGNHQGIVAQVPGLEYCDIADILAVAKERSEKPFIILLDGIEDPHNLGSIIRSAECAGAHGVIIPKRRSASVTAAAGKAAAGAVEYMKVARVSNLAGAIDRLKDEGMWIAGADMNGTPMDKTDLKGAVCLVIGSEGDGMSHLVREKCDFTVSIPMWGKIDSLNAAVAAAVLMYEKKRQG